MVSSSIRGSSSLALVGGLACAGRGEASFLSRVQDAEGAAFVGRREMLDALHALVCEADHDPRVVAVVGAPGVGKSALVRALGRRLDTRRHVWIRGERDGIDVASFELAIERSIDGGLDALGRGEEADVLVVDSFERCAALGTWLLEDGLLRAGPRLCVVLVSRERVSAAGDVRAHVDGWSALSLVVREVLVSPLADEEAAEYLGRRGIPAFAQVALVAQAAGYPLALKWLCDKLEVGAKEEGAEIEVQTALAAMFASDAPTPLHARALLALAIPDVLDEGMLEAMLGCGRAVAGEIFAWLAGRAFVESRGEGLVPHGVVRDAFYGKLLRTDGGLHVEMASSASDVLLRRAATEDASAMHGALVRSLVARRWASPQLRELEVDLAPRMVLRPATTRHLQPMAAIVRRWEGEESERLFRLAFSDDRSLCWAVVGAHGEVLGVLGCVALRGLPKDRFEGDTAVEAAVAAWRALDGAAAFDALAARWWMTSTSYQAHDPALVAIVTGALFVASRQAPRTRYVVAVAPTTTAAEPWSLVLDAQPSEEMDGGAVVSVGDLHRLVGPASPGETAARIARERLFALAQVGPSATRTRLSPEALVTALRDALPKTSRPRDLATSPLLALRAVRGAGPAALVRVLTEAIEDLGREPGYQAPAEVLKLTYLGEPRKQEAAAADLGLPFGTYRHRLRAAIADLARAIAAAEEAFDGPASAR